MIPNGAKIALWPRGILGGIEAKRAVDMGRALFLAGGPLAFSAIDVFWRAGPGPRQIRSFTLPDFKDWLQSADHEAQGDLDRQFSKMRDARPLLHRIKPGERIRPLVMGIVNVTPDSFSDGGNYADPQRAIEHGRKLIGEGANILDIGGESTRPGAAPVSLTEELDRVLLVIEGLRGTGIPISIDTRHAEVMKAALAAGANIINDVTALEGEAASMDVAAGTDAPVILMHMQGEPGTMQEDPRYDDVVLDIFDYLNGRIEACEAAGIPRSRLVIDPGIGFGKTPAQNLDLLESLAVFHATGAPVLLGASRKRFISTIDRRAGVTDRLGGSLAAALAGAASGAQIVRVHDVKETVQALEVDAHIGLAALAAS